MCLKAGVLLCCSTGLHARTLVGIFGHAYFGK